jgi:tropomyosin
MDKFKEKVNSLRVDLDAEKAKNEEIVKSVKEWEEKFSAKDQENGMLLKKVDKLETNLDETEKNLKETMEKLRELEIKNENNERQVTKLEQEKSKLEEENDQLRETIKQKEKEYDEALKSIADL